MKDTLSELRELLRRKLTDDLQSASLANLVLRLVMPGIGRVLKEERDKVSRSLQRTWARGLSAKRFAAERWTWRRSGIAGHVTYRLCVTPRHGDLARLSKIY